MLAGRRFSLQPSTSGNLHFHRGPRRRDGNPCFRSSGKKCGDLVHALQRNSANGRQSDEMDIESTIVTETRKEVRRNWRSSSKQTVRPRWVALFRIIGSDSRLGVGSPEETRTIRMRMISPVTREMKQF